MMLLSFFNKNIFSRSFNPVPIFISWLCPFSDTLGISRELGLGNMIGWHSNVYHYGTTLSSPNIKMTLTHVNNVMCSRTWFMYAHFTPCYQQGSSFHHVFFLIYVKISFSFSFFRCCEVSHSFVLQNQNIKWLSNCSLATYFFFFICFYTQLLWII